MLFYNNGETEILSKNRASIGSDQATLRTRSSEGLPDCRGKLFIFWIGLFLEMTTMECKHPVQLNDGMVSMEVESIVLLALCLA